MTSAYPLVSHISIHALREEGDGFGTILRRGMVAFLSTPSARRATDKTSYKFMFQGISIHALREEGDGDGKESIRNIVSFLSTPSARRATASRNIDGQRVIGISIHALREEGDNKCGFFQVRKTEFLSTPSARRATWAIYCRPLGLSISIHALREEGDRPIAGILYCFLHFYPRPPRGGRHHKRGEDGAS